ncbi:unnamed protein product [marine sediment metagenome]|uniref:Alpha-ribazole phosphatase n=1 Tax=marine sediment metagenome TaxID=412755 RepID=X0WQI2_9ZZZZ
MQLEHMAEKLRLTDIGAIYSSDLKRSAIGAQIIARHHDVSIHVLPELREMYFGDWEGMTLAEVRENYPDKLEKREADVLHFEPPGGGESIADLSKRILPCFQQIIEKQKGHDILIVGHGGVNRVILGHALGLDLDRIFRIQQDYGCLNIIDFFEDTTVVRLING